MLHVSDNSKRFAAVALFALCVAPTFISYRPYVFTWDDSEYMYRSVMVSRAFWSESLHGISHLRAIGEGMYSIRPPAMTLMGLPWGSLTSWDASGKCFITLAAAIGLLAASCLYLLLRIGVDPLYVALASACVGASLGPFPARATAHEAATAFLADSLFAWTALAALLLIPHEARTYDASSRGGVLRGILWGGILSLGVMTKVNFLYFIVLILPCLLVIRFRHGGMRSALAAIVALCGCSAPAIIYLARHGAAAFENGKASSFGAVAQFYNTPILEFLSTTVRESPGLAVSLMLTAGALTYLVIRRRSFMREPDFLPLLIILGFGLAVMAAPNRQIRYAFPAIVALPFLAALLMNARGLSMPARSAALASSLAFCCFLAASVPTRYRADRQQTLARSDAVLAQADRCHAKRVLLATDSPTLSQDLLNLAIAVSPEASIKVDTLAYKAMSGGPIDDDYRAIGESDQVVFQDKAGLSPPFTNLRVPEYERYTRQQLGSNPTRIGQDLSVYSRRCREK